MNEWILEREFVFWLGNRGAGATEAEPPEWLEGEAHEERDETRDRRREDQRAVA